MLWPHVLVVSLVLLVSSVASAQVVNPRVTTDGSVDCSSLKSIARDVCKGKTTKQDKAIALYEFARRVMYHYQQRSEASNADNHDSLRLINTYGYALCSQQSLLLVDLWQAAGIDGYVWSVPGHTTPQAEYDGGHHWFDPQLGGYVYLRDGKTVASLQDIAKDRTILTKAVAEGRAPKAFMPCKTMLRDDAARLVRESPEYLKTLTGHVDDMTFMANLAGEAAKWKWGAPGKPRYRPQIKLRRGERVEFLWDALPGEFNCVSSAPGKPARRGVVPADQLPPHHFCGDGPDKKCPLQYPLWKPYTKVIKEVRTARYYANGRHMYRPDLRKGPAKGDFVANSFGRGEASAPALRVAKAGEASALVVKMATPQVYTSAVVTATFRRATAKDVSHIYLSRDGKAWKQVYTAPAKAGEADAKVELRKIVGLREVWLKFEVRTPGDPAAAGLDAVSIECIFQHNMFARSHLIAGKNSVQVRLDGPKGLQPGDFTVTYVWKEGARKKTHTQQITRSPTNYVINVGGKELPRMISLTLAAAR